MSEIATQSAHPLVNLDGLQERVLLQAELMHHEARLRDFASLRDHLMATGQDANAEYRQIQSQREQVMAELKKLTPAPVRPAAVEASIRPPGHGSLLSLPIAAARFDPAHDSPWFGYSGSVQLGPAHEGTTVIPAGTTGSIRSRFFWNDGGVAFDGHIVASPAGGPKEYFSLHSWTHLIPFPAPAVTSTFTYSFEVDEELAVAMVRGPSVLPITFWSFVAVGETENFVGQEVVVNTNAGWPLVVALNGVPDATEYLGRSIVQRSLVVQPGHRPAVGLVVGAVIALGTGSEVLLDSGGTCFIWLASIGDAGLKYGFVNFRYDPIPLVIGPA